MIEHIQKTYQAINSHTIDQGILAKLYSEDVVFIDPFHRIEGRAALESYFGRLYRNVNSIEFQYGDAVRDGDRIFMEWQMTLSHPKLRKGKPVIIDGTTRFQLRDDRVCAHRDYFDTAQMLYENLPVLGGIIRAIKRRMGQ